MIGAFRPHALSLCWLQPAFGALEIEWRRCPAHLDLHPCSIPSHTIEVVSKVQALREADPAEIDAARLLAGALPATSASHLPLPTLPPLPTFCPPLGIGAGLPLHPPLARAQPASSESESAAVTQCSMPAKRTTSGLVPSLLIDPLAPHCAVPSGTATTGAAASEGPPDGAADAGPRSMHTQSQRGAKRALSPDSSPLSPFLAGDAALQAAVAEPQIEATLTPSKNGQLGGGRHASAARLASWTGDKAGTEGHLSTACMAVRGCMYIATIKVAMLPHHGTASAQTTRGPD